MIEQLCRSSCCKIRFCPLVVAFGRTIHKFQGQEAGPGKSIETIVVDPGSKQFETSNPGTLNCCITRATTIGDENCNNSAIYLIGPHINSQRFQNMTHSIYGKKYYKVKLRTMWVAHLQRQKCATIKRVIYFDGVAVNKLQSILNGTNLSLPLLDTIIQYHVQHMNSLA